MQGDPSRSQGNPEGRHQIGLTLPVGETDGDREGEPGVKGDTLNKGTMPIWLWAAARIGTASQTFVSRSTVRIDRGTLSTFQLGPGTLDLGVAPWETRSVIHLTPISFARPAQRVPHHVVGLALIVSEVSELSPSSG